MSDNFYIDYPRRQDGRPSVRARANEHELRDVISAYTSPDQSGGGALSWTQVTRVAVVLVVSLAAAGAFVGLSGVRPQKTAAVEPPLAATPAGTAPSKSVGEACAGQTWPYVSRECLAARGEPPPAAVPTAAAAKKGN